MRHFPLVLIALFTATALSAQTRPDEATLLRIAAVTHRSMTALQAEDEATYTVWEGFDAPWETKSYTPEEATANANYLLDHGILRYGVYPMSTKKKLRLLTSFPEGFDGNPASSEIGLLSSNLTDSLGNKIEVSGMVVNYNFNFSNGTEAEGMGHNTSGRKISAGSRFSPKPIGKLSGDITYGAQSLIGYEKVTISRSDVGTEYSLGTLTFTVKQFDEKLLVLSHKSPKADLGFVQLNAAGEPLKRNASKFGGGTVHTMDFIYAAFEKNPALPKEELEALVLANADKYADQDNMRITTVTRSYGGVEKVVIYRPILCERVEKTVKVE